MQFSWAKNISDEQWKDVLVSGQNQIPSLPPEAIQSMFVGSSGREAFNEPAIFWNLTKETAAALGQSFTDSSRVLDVGVGWGRLYRWLLRDLSASQIKGIDIDPSTIQMCSEMMPYGDFELVSVGSPYPQANGGYDLAYFYSVFSHLSEPNAKKVLATTLDVLKPGGLVALTTLRIAHIDVWNGHLDHPGYSESLAKVNFSRTEWWERAAEGEHLYVPTGGGDPSRPSNEYGEAVVPKPWWEKVEGYRLVRFDRTTGLPQAYVVLQKI